MIEINNERFPTRDSAVEFLRYIKEKGYGGSLEIDNQPGYLVIYYIYKDTVAI